MPRFVYPNGSGFRALIRNGDKILYLGTFDTPEKASEAAERMAKELRGKADARKTDARPKRPRPIAAKVKARRRRVTSKRRRARSS
ncbi:MAG TPA: AP2 domain-containing protein [Hyphomicrobiaceae bacterium]|nr:AP2 domain-containing protein [Hyphomicrobiaceae bacterium]